MLADKPADLLGTVEGQLVTNAHCHALIYLVPNRDLMIGQESALDVGQHDPYKSLVCPPLPVVVLIGEHARRRCPKIDVVAIESDPDINATCLVIDGDRPSQLIVIRSI